MLCNVPFFCGFKGICCIPRIIHSSKVYIEKHKKKFNNLKIDERHRYDTLCSSVKEVSSEVQAVDYLSAGLKNIRKNTNTGCIKNESQQSQLQGSRWTSMISRFKNNSFPDNYLPSF